MLDFSTNPPDGSGIAGVKTTLTTMLLATATALVAHAAPDAEQTLKPGSAMNLEPVTAAKWIQGEAPKAFEPGKVYIFECWATWCGPCIKAIPHVNDLYKKYHEKGLNVLGMNVWEDGQEKVEKFVKGKGDGMSYPVAYTGKGSAFENEWLKAAGVRGIPHAFVVMDGKLLFTTHPARLSEEIIEKLLAGGDSAKSVADGINAAAASEEKAGSTIRDFQKAAMANDLETMAVKLAELEKADPKNTALAPMKLDLLIAQKDYPAALKAMEELPEGQIRQMSIMRTAGKIGSSPDGTYPADFIKSVTKSFTDMAEAPDMKKNPYSSITLCTLQWKVGDKKAALASAKKAADAAKALASEAGDGRQMKMPTAPFERYAKSVEDGTLPSSKDFRDWLQEAMSKAPKAAE